MACTRRTSPPETVAACRCLDRRTNDSPFARSDDDDDDDDEDEEDSTAVSGLGEDGWFPAEPS